MRPHQKRQKRIEFFEPLTIQFDSEIASVENLSLSGCLLQTQQWHKVEPSWYELLIQPEGRSPIPHLGRIVRAKMVPNRDGATYQIGLQFNQNEAQNQEFKKWLSSVFINTGLTSKAS